MPIPAKEPTENESQETRLTPSLSHGLAPSSGRETSDFDLHARDAATSSDQAIGRYRLTNLVGEGGMGQVWRAVQEEPVRRTVAIKLMGKYVGKDALGRFEAERQAIAMMDHPNIAKILDADTTDDGRPYFVMELVRGVPLDQYCNGRKLGIEDRLRLMLSVCRAVQHAHQKAIIHRDLKHSNILVAENDNQAVPKVIDFGLAKAIGTERALTDRTVFTEYGRVVGTIAYMSPEQADSDEEDIDTRTDIYSLGVVMYKLLTGKTPIQMEGDAHSFLKAIKIIKDKDASAPSVAIRKRENASDWTASNTPMTLPKYSDRLKGDLDAIVLKALEKDRRSRYETAGAFAEDIERYLRHEPIHARPKSGIQTVRKFVRRNRGLVASTACIVTLLVLGLIGTISSLLMALDAQAETQTQLVALQLKSSASDWKSGNTESAWQTLKQMQPESAGWVRRYLANEMSTCEPSDVFHGHAHIVLTIDVSPDGSQIVSGGADDVVHLWDCASDQPIHRIVMDEIVTSVRFATDGSTFAVADRSNTVSIFDVKSGERVQVFGPFDQDVASIAFHPIEPIIAFGFLGNDSQRIANGRLMRYEATQPAKLTFFRLKSGELILDGNDHPEEITSLEFDQSGKKLFSSCMDGFLRIWNCEVSDNSELACEQKLKVYANPGGTHELAVSPDGSKVVCGGNDKGASLFDTEDGRLLSRFSGHTTEVLGVDFSPVGDLIATSATDQTVLIWDLEGNLKKRLKGHSGPVNETRFLADGRRIITASDDLTLRRWSLDSEKATIDVSDFAPGAIWQADFSPDARTVAAVGEDGRISLIDTRTGVVIRKLQQKDATLCVEWLDNGRLITAGEGPSIDIWEKRDSQEIGRRPSRRISVEDDAIWDLDVSPDQSRLVTAGSSGIANIFDADSLAMVGQLAGHTEGLASARYSPDGQYLVTASDDQTVKVWAPKTLKLLQTLQGHRQPVWRAIFSPTNPELIASSCADGSLLLWNWKQGEIKIKFRGHASQVAGLTFSPDGRCLLSASDDGTVIVWDVERATELFVFEQQPTSPVIHVSFSKNGKTLVTTGVGKLTLRHASETFHAPYLRRDATESMLETEFRVIEPGLSEDELQEIHRKAELASKHNPGYISLRTLGIAKLRLGKITEAIDALLESQRLQRVIHGVEDIRPLGEGYLAISLLERNRFDAAKKMKSEFDRLAENWPNDSRVNLVRKQVEHSFAKP